MFQTKMWSTKNDLQTYLKKTRSATINTKKLWQEVILFDRLISKINLMMNLTTKLNYLPNLLIV